MCAGAKGGQGCTTIAAVLAVLAAHNNQPTLLLDTRGDAAPTLRMKNRDAPHPNRGYDHIQIFGEDARIKLTEALANEGIRTIPPDNFRAVPTQIEFVTVDHRDADRATTLRDSLGLDRER